VTSEYHLNIEKRPLYLYACVQGDSVGRDVVRQYLDEILEAFRSAQYSRMLIKKEISTALNAEDLDHVTDEIVRLGAQGIRIAVVDETGDVADAPETRPDNARAAGLEVAFFDSFTAGVHWLLHG
jgi:hypothetical protein